MAGVNSNKHYITFAHTMYSARRLIIVFILMLLSACSTTPMYEEPDFFDYKFLVKYECEQGKYIHSLSTSSRHKLSKPAVCLAIQEGANEYGFNPNKCQVVRINQLSKNGIPYRTLTQLSQISNGENK